MKTLIATATLTVMFLSAGAFAGNDTTTATQSRISNVTVIAKNGQWPVKGQTSFDPCSVRRCLDA
jgi:hypothetical protein